MTASSTSKELLYAILSMDSYYRGTTAKGDAIELIPGASDRIGNASLSFNYTPSPGLPAWNDVGFSATVYTVDGKAIIAYRGTDNIGLDVGAFFTEGDIISMNSDVINGWSLGAGYYPAAQGQLAIDLYEKVSGHPISQGGSSSIELTGHSLGGGLAGYVSVLTGSQAIGYDNMPFHLAALLKSNADALENIFNTVVDAFNNGIDFNDPTQLATIGSQL